MSAREEYIAAAMVPCPKCKAGIGNACQVVAFRCGQNCGYRACSYMKALPEPHLERAVKARQEAEAQA